MTELHLFFVQSAKNFNIDYTPSNQCGQPFTVMTD